MDLMKTCFIVCGTWYAWDISFKFYFFHFILLIFFFFFFFFFILRLCHWFEDHHYYYEVICLCLPPNRTLHKVNDSKVNLKWGWGEGKVGQEPRLELCWSSINLVQCGPDEPSWTWTQIWVQAHMPDYSLNWTMGSSAITKHSTPWSSLSYNQAYVPGHKGVSDAARPPKGDLAKPEAF